MGTEDVSRERIYVTHVVVNAFDGLYDVRKVVVSSNCQAGGIADGGKGGV